MKARTLSVVTFVALATASFATATESPSSTLSLSPDPVPVDGYVQITLTIAAAPTVDVEPRLTLDNLDLVHGPRERQHYSWIDGSLSYGTSFIWLAAPRAVGTAAVDADVVVGGTAIDLEPRSVRVAESGAGEPATSRRRDPLVDMLRQLVPTPRPGRLEPPRVRLHATVDPVDPYRGQQTTYTLSLLVERRSPVAGQLDIESIFPRRVPTFRGFWSQELPLPDDARPRTVVVGGLQYWRQPVLRRALFPYRPGEASIEAAEVELRTVLRRTTAAGREPLSRRTLRRRSEPVTVRTRSLPPAPPDFDRVVGDFELSAELEPSEVSAGEAAVLTVRLAGRGEASSVSPPDTPTLAAVEVLSAEPALEHDVVNGLLHTSRLWRYTVLPADAGSWILEPFELTYFEPHAGRYQSASTSSLSLRATADDDGVESSAPPHSDPTLGRSTALVGVAVVAVVALIGASLRHRGAHRRRRLLRRVEAAARGRRPRQVAVEVERAWRSFLDERWPVPATAEPKHWPRILAREGVDDAGTEALQRLVEDLRYLRHAPRLASSDVLCEEIVERSRTVARRLG